MITVREAARLSSFPDWFRVHATQWHGLRQLGNAVPPLMAKAIGSTIIEALAAEIETPSSSISLGEESLLRLNLRDAAKDFGVPEDRLPRDSRRKDGRKEA